MNRMHGIIFAYRSNPDLRELTQNRNTCSIPYGGRYRIIDFMLSNMVNAGMTDVGLIVHTNYQSLLDHVGSGKDWDLARRGGGVQILPPYITAFSNSANFLYNTRLEALKSINSFISNCKEDYVILSDCDVICNLDLSALLEEHIRSGADATFIVKRSYLTKEMKAPTVVMESNEDGRLIGVEEYSGNKSGYADVSLNIWVTQRRFLEDIVLDATAHGYDDFTNDVIKRNLSAYTFKVYPCSDYFAAIHSLTDYYMCSMDLLDAEVRRQLFDVKARPIYTKVRNSPPTVYSREGIVKNSLIADGCLIEGTVENSILFRGVKVAKGAVVKNCILMQDTEIGKSTEISNIITDKNVKIGDELCISSAEGSPLYISKKRVL